MTLKTFNINEDIYGKFSHFCKGHGISMSKQVELFMASQVEDEPEIRKEYLKKLERLRKGKFIKVKNFREHFGL